MTVVNHLPFTKLYFITFVQSLKMPANKRIKIRVDISGDERASPVNLQQSMFSYM